MCSLVDLEVTVFNILCLLWKVTVGLAMNMHQTAFTPACHGRRRLSFTYIPHTHQRKHSGPLYVAALIKTIKVVLMTRLHLRDGR